ncbi:MAG TPA: EamA family transporter [Verrucomicrobiae bacterium]|nr:EamA family transporter [Verrucomicrobiae bacterium]
MSLWIAIAVFAYFLFAISGIIDKFLLTHVDKHPIVFAFYSGIAGPLAFVLAPFGLKALSMEDYFIAVVAGGCFTIGLYYLYCAIRQTSVSRILPIEGGMVPMFTLVLAYFLLGERLETVQNLAFIFLVSGAVLISFKHDEYGWHSKALKDATIAAILFALAFVFTKYIFEQSNFVTGMVWTRVGSFYVALAFLLSKSAKKHILQAPKQTKTKSIALYYGSRAFGTSAGFLQNYAISLGSVTIVNALQGVQFIFLLVLTTALSIYYPHVLKEKITKGIMLLKIVSIILISTGLVLLSV